MTPLLTFRKQTKVGRAELAVAVGVHYTHLCRIENGKQVPSAAVARKISQFFGGKVSVDEILFPEDHAAKPAKMRRSTIGATRQGKAVAR